MTKFEATEIDRNTYAPLSAPDNRPPRVFFRVEPDRYQLLADPPGASIVCTSTHDRSSYVVIKGNDGQHIAVVTVHTPDGFDLTDETIAIASALYWSWWRAEDMHGRTWVEHD